MRPEEKIIKTFYDNKTSRLYYNQIKELSKLSDNTLSRILNNLVEEKILLKEVKKSNTFYKIIDKKIVGLMFSKFDINKLRNLNLDSYVPINEFTKNVPKQIYSIILFGSVSRKEETKNSDIDLLVILNYHYEKKLNDIYSKTMKKEIEKIKKDTESISIYPINIFFSEETPLVPKPISQT